MSKTGNTYTKQTVRFGVRLLCFLILTLSVLIYAMYVLTPKYEYGICSMNNFYAQPEDSIDVLAVGTSQLYAGINTNVLWARYGIAAYDLCSAEQPFWVSYYTIREALKTQHPQLILLDAKPASYLGSYSKHARVILSTYGIRGLDNRFGAILSSVKTVQDSVQYLLGLPAVHNNYEGITAEAFSYPVDNNGRGNTWKGYIETDKIQELNRPEYDENIEAKKINAREEEYARKIFELANENDIELMLIVMPYPDYATDQAYYKTLWEIAGEYGINVLDYNQPAYRNTIDEKYDFADYQHLSVRGSYNFSLRFGNELRKLITIQDRRKDEKYVSYDTCASIWYEKNPSFGTYP